MRNLKTITLGLLIALTTLTSCEKEELIIDGIEQPYSNDNNEVGEKVLNILLAPVNLNTLLGNQLTYSHNLTKQEVSNILDVSILIADNSGAIYTDLSYTSFDEFTDVGGHYLINPTDIQINFNAESDYVTSTLYNAASVRLRITYIPD